MSCPFRLSVLVVFILGCGGQEAKKAEPEPGVTARADPGPPADAEKGLADENLTLAGHGGMVYQVAFSPDGRRLVTASEDKTVRLWDLAGSEETRIIGKLPDAAYSAVFSPDGKRIAATCRDNRLRVWDVKTGEQLLSLDARSASGKPSIRTSTMLRNVQFSCNGKRLASLGDDATVRVWDADKGTEIYTLPIRHAAGVSVAFSPDGNRLASASERPTVQLWDMASGKEERRELIGHRSTVSWVTFNADGKRLATGSHDRTVKLWDMENPGLEIHSYEGHSHYVNTVAFSPNGKQLASGSQDGVVKLWDTQSGKEIRSIPAEAVVLGVAYSPDGKRLAVALGTGLVKVWPVMPKPAASGDRTERRSDEE